MRGIDIRNWSVLDWLGIASLFLSAAILLLNAALKDAPALATQLPDIFASSALAYVPLPLLVFSLIFLFISSNRKSSTTQEIIKDVSANPFPNFYGIDKRSEFKLLPICYALELTATIPYVELRFYAVCFTPKPVLVTSVKVSLRLGGGLTLEDIPLRHDDLTIDLKTAPMIVCRRNLQDSELKVIPKKSAHESWSFDLIAKATESDGHIHSYGPISAALIYGWTNGFTA